MPGRSETEFSTRLHMDVADAVNVMLYASDRPDGQPGCAVWDLYRAEDADKIRSYLKRKFDKTHKFTDPIHSQLFYLDSNKRKELAERYGVVSWRVYQYPVGLSSSLWENRELMPGSSCVYPCWMRSPSVQSGGLYQNRSRLCLSP